MRLTQEQYNELKQRRGEMPLVAEQPPPLTSKQRLQALGRLRDGEMNKTETRYAQYLEGERIAGEILWWRFECIKLRLYNNTHLTPDFFLMRKNGSLEAHDVKGSRQIVEDDALVKMKWAASEFPFRICLVYPILQKNGGGWEVHEL